MSGTIYTVDQAAATIVTGQKANVNTIAVPLVETPTPCKRVRLIAPVDAGGAALNTAPIFFGDANSQPDWIAADGSRDRIVHIIVGAGAGVCDGR